MLLNNNSRFVVPLSPILNADIILKKVLKGRITVLHTVPSTNQYFIDNMQYIESGDIVVTEHQTQGRGRSGKIWCTPKGQSICLSMYWKLHQKLPNTMKLSFIISFFVATALKSLGVSFPIQIKWPNDLYVYNRKLAGILIEIIPKKQYVTHLIIGIGINISIDVHTKLALKMSKNWIDLNYIGIFPNRNILVAILIEKLREALNKFERNQFFC